MWKPIPRFLNSFKLAFLCDAKKYEEAQVNNHHNKEVAEIDDEVAGMIAQGVEVFIDFTFLKQIQTLSNMLLNVN